MVGAIRSFALCDRGLVSCNSFGCRAFGGYVPTDRAVRIVVSLRDYVRCMVWRYWPLVVRDRAFAFRFLLLFLQSIYSP